VREGGRTGRRTRRTRRSGYRTKNKTPTRQCGELQEPQKCMSEQILTPNSTGGGIPTPVTKTNIF